MRKLLTTGPRRAGSAAEMAALKHASDDAQRANRAQARLLAMTSHELRTPLNGIIGVGKLLADTPLTPEQRNYVDAITVSGESLLSLVEDLMEFARFEAGEPELRPQRAAVRPLIGAVVELQCGRAYAKDVDLGYYVSPAVPESALFDAERLRQILVNIVGNAIKFTDTGGVSIEVDHHQGVLHILVSDTGPGIDADEQSRIFGEFEQARTGMNRPHEGIGLGLAISRRIAEAAGGTIAVESKPGHGAQFSVTFPVCDPVAEELPQHRLTGIHAVIASPASTEAELIGRMLQDAGATTEVAADTENLANAHRGGDTILLVDDRIEGGAEAFLAGGHAFEKVVALIRAEQRNTLGAAFKQHEQSFMTRPVRAETLLRVIGDRFARGQIKAMPEHGIVGKPRPLHGLNVLLAEDNPVNALLTLRMLERLGHRVRHVDNGRDAVEAVTPGKNGGTSQFDVILMDLHMPGMDGIDAIQVIRREEDGNRSRHTPIIAITADILPETARNVLDAGADGILTKPLEAGALADKLVMLKQQVA